MARKVIDIGTVGNDGTGDSIRDSFRKVNDNFRELYSSLGLGERLTFIGLDDAPDSYVGQNDPITGNTPIVTINNTESGLAFKRLVEGNGVSIDFTTNPNEIVFNSDFSEVSADPSPQLGGDLSLRSGGNQYRVLDAGTTGVPLQPLYKHELVNKAYADTKISRAGTNTVDPETGNVNAAAGRMSGPLILARDPEPEDDEIYDGLIAATKRYVDNASFGSVANLYVATSGQDERPGVSAELQGRALAYAYRTLEAALKRAEELVLEARQELGPYQKVLTYNNGADICSLSSITTSPSSGVGFAGSVNMSVDTVNLNGVGTNYYVGDILTLVGGTVAVGGAPCRIEVLDTLTTPGAILSYRIISTGIYSVLPPATGCAVTITTSAAPVGVGAIGAGATFDLTFNVNNISISNGGTGYSLVSVRITGGGGTGAFGTANVTGGVITGITIDDRGSGFTSLPVIVADLPRFAIFTAGLRTDFTGDVTTDTPTAFRGRDIREGLYLRGENSRALAQILSHSGALDSSGNELFDVDIKYGSFELGEPIAYGDVSKEIQISVLVESGIYEENLPLKVPQNVAIIGDEFRRCIIRPRRGTSSSPWAFINFRRDETNDGLTTATQLFGYHYLQDSTQPVYPKINNKGDFRAAATLLTLNKSFLSEDIVSWMDIQIANGTAPFTTSFNYNRSLCKRDVGLLVDAFVFDLKYGGYNRTISAGLKYYQSASALIAITTQLSQYLTILTRLDALMQNIIVNSAVTPSQDIFPQVIDLAYQAESGSGAVITALINTLKDVIDGSGSVNYPKDNNEMDVFLCNDANIIRAITCQGHGGFMMTLDPEGQILAKSPYAQECASFARSLDTQVFHGGMLVDGFSGNLRFKIETVVSPTRLEVSGLERKPNLPCSFIVRDTVYRINYFRDWTYSPSGSTATFILDETTPWPYTLFTYNESICSRDVGLIIDGLGYDIVFGTNYNARKAGLTYRQANAQVVIDDQKDLTLRAIEYAHTLAKSYAGSAYDDSIDSANNTLTLIVDRGPLYAATLILPNPPGVSAPLSNAKSLLLSNIQFIQDETVGWINAQIAGSIAPFSPAFVYDSSTCARDVGYIIEALAYDVIYGGNSKTRDAGLKYYDGVGSTITNYISGQVTETAAAIDYVKYLAKQVVQNLAPASTYSGTPRTTGTATDAGTVTLIDNLMNNLSATISGGVGAAPIETLPNLSAYAYATGDVAARTALQTNKSTIQSDVIDYIDFNANLYELLMPGNRSMLANDFTQVNDLGYGIYATNGGLVEAVSMFTYYCHISYYSLNGAQIRSVSGSSAHGNYALVAEGSDPLEVPTPTSIWDDLSQRVDCYYPTPTYENVQGGLFIYVTNYKQAPLANSELEIDHGNVIFRYPVTSVATEGYPTGVARINITSDTTGNFDGLYASVPDGTKMTMRMLSEVILTGDLADVATRPSTGLRLIESDTDVYRVLQFEDYTDPLGPYEVVVSTGTPGSFQVLLTITDINTNVITTSKNHNLVLGDKIIPRTTANNLVAGTTYYVISVPKYNQLTVSASPSGSTFVLTNGTGLTIKCVKTHKLIENYLVEFQSSGTLPAPLLSTERYWVASDGLTDTQFSIANQRDGNPFSITTAGTGTITYSNEGLTKTTLRENYDYINLTLFQPGELVSTFTPVAVTISVGVTTNFSSGAAHGLTTGDVVRVITTGSLPTGLEDTLNYHVLSAGLTGTNFRLSLEPGGNSVETSGTYTGTVTVGKVTGRAGDTQFAVVPLSPEDTTRADLARFVFKGEEYIVQNYENEADTGTFFGRVTLNRPLVDSIIAFDSMYTINAAVPIRSIGANGSLTIRISLTRVTGHDLLEIGTGSYADTNYPNEIYGPSVNPLNETNETEERDVGRVFYVTTDQFGNFSVGPYFRVDQGTGRVTFSAAIALSNLDGIGFKRGVPIAEFSTDSSFSDNAVDTVPTENATRIYLDRRLGLTHAGSPTDEDQLIPPVTGGFMSLDGQLAMKSDMDLGNNKIVQVANPINPQDAVNLRSLTWDNFQEQTIGSVDAADLLVFTGSGNFVQNASVVGDITLSMDSTAHTVDAQINPGVILNADVNATAGIEQSKLSMTLASTRAAAPTGTAAQKQAASGLASFDSASFDITDGFVSIKGNSVTLSSIAQIATKTVLGNSALTTGNVTAVPFSTVVSDGLGVKKAQYSSTGFLRRTASGSFTSDSDFVVVEAASGSAASPEASKLVIRDSNGDFGARIVDVSQLKIDNNVAIDTGTGATNGYLRYYGYGSQGGIIVQTGSLAADDVTYYDNDLHQFRTQNGLSLAPIRASSAEITALTTGGTTTPGTVTGYWSLSGTSRFQATYAADLAENYEGDAEYEVGTVLVFGGDKEVTTSNSKGDTRVAGVVSNTAAFAMYDACPGLKNLIALQGRVPCKVVGKINKGDILITAGIPGVAVAATGDVKVGSVIGKALENYDSDHIGTIEISVGRT